MRVAVTRDEPGDGPLSTALRAVSLTPVMCRVVEAQPAADQGALVAAATGLESYQWAIFASQRAVQAVSAARGSAWPADLKTAAVGSRTAAALLETGVTLAPVVAGEAGADALWDVLKDRDWRGVRVLLPVVADGRRIVIDGLTHAGADVMAIEAYRMVPRSTSDILEDWTAAAPDAVIIGSPSAATILIDAVGRDACASLSAVVAIGPTTAAALKARGLEAMTSPTADFAATARFV